VSKDESSHVWSRQPPGNYCGRSVGVTTKQIGNERAFGGVESKKSGTSELSGKMTQRMFRGSRPPKKNTRGGGGERTYWQTPTGVDSTEVAELSVEGGKKRA